MVLKWRKKREFSDFSASRMYIDYTKTKCQCEWQNRCINLYVHVVCCMYLSNTLPILNTHRDRTDNWKNIFNQILMVAVHRAVLKNCLNFVFCPLFWNHKKYGRPSNFFDINNDLRHCIRVYLIKFTSA